MMIEKIFISEIVNDAMIIHVKKNMNYQLQIKKKKSIAET